MPYVVSIVVAIITSLFAYLGANKKSKTDINSLKESNNHEIEKLINQHKMNIDAIERQHELEKEKMQMEHQHKLEIMKTQTVNDLGTNILNNMDLFNIPEVKEMVSKALRKNK